jgi:MFS family permease
LLALGLLVLVFAESTTFVGVALVAFLIGLSLAPIVISQDTWLHELLPERMRGRGFAIRELLNNAVGALASVLAAAGVLVASVLGSAEPYRLTLYALGGALIAATLLVGRLAVQHRLATSQPAAARPSVMAGESEVPASVPERGAVPRAHPGNPVARSSDGLL